ncbi:hypothetical protein [Bradyrhizobium macuxiense]|uniref:hypothetical protein n=1 Tax=Bradyrhizobium macuxiense TaxID=1755647 RepID=UPI0011BF5BCC|nr:hypothetical protein [Bradyrhizobium macuxiense]
MSFQLTVLKVLAGQSAGRASVAEIRHAVEILMNSGKDWTDRMKRLAQHAPDLNIFSARYVLCNHQGWEITDEGRQFLAALDAAVANRIEPPHRSVADLQSSKPAAKPVAEVARSLDPPQRRRDRPRRRRGKDRSNRRRA